MSDLDERDLSAAFERLTAPRSTAQYAERAPVEPVGTRRSLAGALAGVLAVLVTFVGAGTFLALRGSHEGGVATAGVGTPPGRTDAAMAYDSTAGLTVMYGGTGAGGRSLSDTWLWNGSEWNRAAASSGPGPMSVARMADDPPAGGVLLVGLPAVPGLQVVCASGSGSVAPAVTGTAPTATGAPTSAVPKPAATAAPGSAVPAPSPKAAGTAPAVTGATASPPPKPVATGAPGSAVPAPMPSLPGCRSTPVATVQTWVFNDQGWHRVAAGGVAPPAGAQVAYDARSGDVLAVQEVYFPCLGTGIPCEMPLSGRATVQPDGSLVCTRTACPITGACYVVGPSAGSLPSHCSQMLGGVLTTWVWAHGRWSASTAVLQPGDMVHVVVSASFVAGGATNAELLVETFCSDVAAKCQPPIDTPYTWDGDAWRVAAAGANTFGLFGPGDVSAMAAAGSTIVAIGSDGAWVASHGEWSRIPASAAPSVRIGAALAPGPGGSVVLFGGSAAPAIGVAVASTSARSAGSDTWTYTPAAGWRRAGGTPPATWPPCPTVGKGALCAVPVLPGAVSPAPTLVP